MSSRVESNFAAGMLVALVVRFIFRYWYVWLGLYAIHYVHQTYFSQQTQNLNAYIGDQEKKIAVLKVDSGVLNLPTEPFYPSDVPNYTERSYPVTIKNDSEGTLRELTLKCKGTVTLPQPDGYPAKVEEDSSITIPQFLDLAPGQSISYVAYFDGLLRAQPGTVKCSEWSAELDDGEIYRKKGQVSYDGLSGVDAHFNAEVSTRPIEYNGREFPMHVVGTIKNVGKTPITSVRILCRSYFWKDNRLVDDYLKPIAVGETATYDAVIPTQLMDFNLDHTSPFPETKGYCHVYSIEQ